MLIWGSKKFQIWRPSKVACLDISNLVATTQQTFVGFQDVLKTSSIRLQRNNFSSSKTYWRYLEDVLKTSWKTRNCYGEDFFKTSWRQTKCLLWISISWRVLEDVLEDKKLLRWRRLQDILKRNKMFTMDIYI